MTKFQSSKDLPTHPAFIRASIAARGALPTHVLLWPADQPSNVEIGEMAEDSSNHFQSLRRSLYDDWSVHKGRAPEKQENGIPSVFTYP